MTSSDAAELIGGAIPQGGGTWADLGAGDGTFTRALARHLGPGGRIYAVDRDVRGLEAIARRAEAGGSTVITVAADFERRFDLPGLERESLDGILLANALHFARDAGAVLARLAEWLRPGGRVVLIEYDRRRASRWVPYPIAPDRLPALAAAAGLSTPVITATRPSAYGGILYVAAADKLGPDARGRT
ncbi:MAG TPA: class I SAM-dependent methyltransferase [Candidatus Eisenbacteria bacterium]